MAEEQVFVSHAPADLELVQELLTTVRNLPIGVHVALEELDSGRSRRHMEGRLSNSDVVVAVLTANGASDQWVNQETGYATAKGIPVVPMCAESVSSPGYLEEQEGARLRPDDREATVFDLLGRLRSVLAPLGTLSTPNWFVRFPCNVEGCGATVTLDIEESQKSLGRMYEHNQALVATCDECGSRYVFNPATLGYVRRVDQT
ncbi:toll/interleukin-1 receptor domain-containing protein [Haloarchaeobius sp. HRN-SO-5]|uniref:toll/interleukin-1 receptor domain-containing protein n=1 Tax=Haloarchaeobius sp. HRN-SO-5 TaxID=3446118 RepID=UPI003EBFF460